MPERRCAGLVARVQHGWPSNCLGRDGLGDIDQQIIMAQAAFTRKLRVSYAKLCGYRLGGVHWHNDFLLTQGKFDVDAALHANLVHCQDSADENALDFGPVLQSDVYHVQLYGNLIFEKAFAPGNTTEPQLK